MIASGKHLLIHPALSRQNLFFSPKKKTGPSSIFPLCSAYCRCIVIYTSAKFIILLLKTCVSNVYRSTFKSPNFGKQNKSSNKLSLSLFVNIVLRYWGYNPIKKFDSGGIEIEGCSSNILLNKDVPDLGLPSIKKILRFFFIIFVRV